MNLWDLLLRADKETRRKMRLLTHLRFSTEVSAFTFLSLCLEWGLGCFVPKLSCLVTDIIVSPAKKRNFYLVTMHITFQRDTSRHVCMYIPYTSILESNSFPSIWVNSVLWHEEGKWVTQFKRNHTLRMRRKEHINTPEIAMCRDGLGHKVQAHRLLLTPTLCGWHRNGPWRTGDTSASTCSDCLSTATEIPSVPSCLPLDFSSHCFYE